MSIVLDCPESVDAALLRLYPDGSRRTDRKRYADVMQIQCSPCATTPVAAPPTPGDSNCVGPGC